MSRPPTSIRGTARQNLLVATVNVALERQLITLDCQPFKAARFEFKLAGLPVLAHVSDSRVQGSATRPSLTHTLSSVPPPRSAGWSDGPGKGNAANN